MHDDSGRKLHPNTGPPPRRGPDPTWYEKLKGRRESDIHLPSHPAEKDPSIERRAKDPVEGLRRALAMLGGK